MKNYNKILEAINRGILLALDDFDDDEVLNIKSKQVLNRDYTKEYLDLMKEVVDLGLPSGTLWCKYNLGVNPNQLTNPKDWYGDYYACGELEPNKTNEDGDLYYGWENYKFGKDYNKLTKYCNNSKYGLNGFTDNLTELLPEDDAAYQNKKLYNFKFCIPTKELIEELVKHTNNYFVNNYDPNKLKHTIDDGGIQGLNGMVFEGKNRNQLFIPAAGYYNGFFIYNDHDYGYLWSSSLYPDDPFHAYNLYMGGSTSIYVNSSSRYAGYSIRPVITL